MCWSSKSIIDSVSAVVQNSSLVTIVICHIVMIDSASDIYTKSTAGGKNKLVVEPV